MKGKILALLAGLMLLTTAVPELAMAQDDEREEGKSSLEEGPPVRRLLLLRSGRFELQPGVTFTMYDTFKRNIGFGASLAYHLTNSFGLGASFSFFPIHMGMDTLEPVTSEGYSERVKRSLAIAVPQMAIDAGLMWSPIFGKFSVFGMIFNYDLHLFAGGGILLFDTQYADEDYLRDESASMPSDFGALAPGGVVGIGSRIYFNNFMAINLEIKDYLASYSEYTRSATASGAEFRNTFMATIGFSMFFPFDVYISR